MQNSILLKAKANGKINLYLDVLDKMENGYHNIESVMQSVSLCDTITLEISDIKGENIIEISSDSMQIPNDKGNLVYKACQGYIDYSKDVKDKQISGKKFDFKIEKNIPVGAGMAGGSSDCATSLKLMNEAFGFLSDKELLKIGVKIGADVCFCLTGGTSICRGIGEKITPLSPLKNVNLVCAIDNSSVSTPGAFKMLDEKYGCQCVPSADIRKMASAIENANLSQISASLYNKFEGVISEGNENIAIIKKIMTKNGALGALMSGSGPSVFGIFENENDQANAYKALKEAKIRAFLCKTI